MMIRNNHQKILTIFVYYRIYMIYSTYIFMYSTERERERESIISKVYY